jgi:hypothetical protein
MYATIVAGMTGTPHGVLIGVKSYKVFDQAGLKPQSSQSQPRVAGIIGSS